MRNLYLAVVLLACSPECPPASAEPATEFEQAIEQVRIDYGLPAVAAAFVTRDGRTEIATSGLRRVDGKVQVSDRDLWHLGSVTKPLTASLAAVLVEKELIGWDTRVAEALAEQVTVIHPSLRNVTLQQLLRHRGGIQEFEEDEEWEEVPPLVGRPPDQRRQFVSWLLARPPTYSPGEVHVYSNAGYSVAATMLETATGRTWESLMVGELLEPLGIDRYAFGWPALKDRGEPWGHWIVEDDLVVHEDLTGYSLAKQGVGPAGDVALTMQGLARFARMHLEGLAGNDGLLSAETIRYLHTVDPVDEDDPYALGWNAYPTHSSHLGSAGTFFTTLYLRREEGVAWMIASNASNPDDTEYGRDLLIAVRDASRAASGP